MRVSGGTAKTGGFSGCVCQEFENKLVYMFSSWEMSYKMTFRSISKNVSELILIGQSWGSYWYSPVL